MLGIGPVPATQRLLGRLGWSIDECDVIELNEAFAAQALAVLESRGGRRALVSLCVRVGQGLSLAMERV